MIDLISKKTLIKDIEAIEARYGNDNSSLIEHGEVLDIIEEATTVDAVAVQHGHWIKKSHWCISCSCCGKYIHDYEGEVELYNFCPNCGAKMD